MAVSLIKGWLPIDLHGFHLMCAAINFVLGYVGRPDWQEEPEVNGGMMAAPSLRMPPVIYCSTKSVICCSGIPTI